MIKFDVASKFSKYPGGRFADHGPHSGEEFLFKCLVPLWEQYGKEQERIEIDFENCMGCTEGFLDQSFGELAALFGKDAVKARFDIVGKNTVEDVIDGVLERAEKQDMLRTPELEKAAESAEQRANVQNFMEWCAEQDPPLFLSQDTGDDYPELRTLDWQKHCTKWCGLDEDKMEQEKLQILAHQRRLNDLFEKAKNWPKRKKGGN